jgi:hypothetical protein
VLFCRCFLRPCLGHLHLVQRASGNRDGGAGPFWDTGHDWVSDEQGSDELFWNDLRIAGGQRPLTFGANNSGKGVGGSMVHWSAFAPRFHPSRFPYPFARRRRCGLAHLLRRIKAGITSNSSLRCPLPGHTFRGATLTITRMGRIPWAVWAT